MRYLDSNLREFLSMSKYDFNDKIHHKDKDVIGHIFGLSECNNLQNFNIINLIEAELLFGLKAHDLTAREEISIKKALNRIHTLKENLYLGEGVLNFIKKQNYNYLKKIDAGSIITSEELILGFCVGAIPAVITAQLVRSKVQKDPDGFRQKLEKMKEELEAAKKEKELDEEENSKTNRMILKITALNVLISNVIKGINNRHLKHTKEI